MKYGQDISLAKKIGAAIVATGALGLPALWMASNKTPADKVALSYGGGPFEGNQYQRTIQPGSSLTINGLFDKWYEYPVTIRNYIVSSDAKEGDKETFDAILASNEDGVENAIELTLSFRLNQSKIRQFHERIGMKYEAWNDEGWKKMLGDNIRQPLNNAVTKALKGFTTDDIKTNPEILSELERAIQRELTASIRTLMGDAYFCGPLLEETDGQCPPFEVVVKSILPTNKEVLNSYEDQKISANGIIVSRNQAQQKIEAAEGEKAAKDAVSEALTPEYIEYLRVQALKDCAKTDGCTIVVTDAGGQLPQLTIPVPTPAGR